MDQKIFCYEKIEEFVKIIKQKVEFSTPKVGIILGKKMCCVADAIDGKKTIKCSEIDGFPVTSVAENGDELAFGTLSSIPVVCLTGRFYYCEGLSLSAVGMPPRLFKLLGCTAILIVGTGTAINPKYQLGHIMILKDQMNLCGLPGGNVLVGPNEDKFGERFPDFNVAYDKDFQKCAKKVAEEMCIEKRVHVGVFAAFAGPNVTSVAENSMLQFFGADACGISIVPEVITSTHCGLRVLACCLITYIGCTDIYNSIDACPQCAERVLKNSMNTLQEFIEKMVVIMGSPKACTCP